MNPNLGRCYELSCNLVVATAGSPWTTLVHGVVRDTHLGAKGAVIFHAWVERDGPDHDEPLVCDPVLNITLPRQMFLRMFDATEVHRYSAKEAAAKAIWTGHYGPWDDMPAIKELTLPELEAAHEPA